MNTKSSGPRQGHTLDARENPFNELKDKKNLEKGNVNDQLFLKKNAFLFQSVVFNYVSVTQKCEQERYRTDRKCEINRKDTKI